MNGQGAPPANPLSAACYADGAAFFTTRVVENVELARDTYRMRLLAPDMADAILPGQFLMVRLAGQQDPLLGRAFAVYDVVRDSLGRAEGVDFVYVVHGKMTAALAACQPGRRVEAWGPLGNGFTPEPTRQLVLVAGGVGYTPFLAVAKERLGKARYGAPLREAPRVDAVTMCYGVRTADLLAGAEAFVAAGVDLRVSSDDGSIGHPGRVTDLLKAVLQETEGEDRLVLCCGPEPMMAAVSQMCLDAGAPCRVSLETPMACGLGICFSCVAKVRQPDGGWDYKRTCVEGPVFDAERIEW